jgi:hypothetical protein
MHVTIVMIAQNGNTYLVHIWTGSAGLDIMLQVTTKWTTICHLFLPLCRCNVCCPVDACFPVLPIGLLSNQLLLSNPSTRFVKPMMRDDAFSLLTLALLPSAGNIMHEEIQYICYTKFKKDSRFSQYNTTRKWMTQQYISDFFCYGERLTDCLHHDILGI